MHIGVCVYIGVCVFLQIGVYVYECIYAYSGVPSFVYRYCSAKKLSNGTQSVIVII